MSYWTLSLDTDALRPLVLSCREPVILLGSNRHVMPREKLSDIAIQRELGSLTGWARKGDTLVKNYVFRSFPQGIAFVNRVADLAENMNHHPDIDIRFTKVLCTLSTHDSGGVTEYDVNLARGIERIFEDVRG